MASREAARPFGAAAGTRNAPVLVLATRVPLRSGDGTPSFILDNAAALADRFDVTILAPRVRGCADVTRTAGLTVRRFAYLPRRWERLAEEAIMPQLSSNPLLWVQAIAIVAGMTVAAVRMRRRERFALVHAQWILPSGLVAWVLHVAFGVPYVVTSRGADAFRLERGPVSVLKRIIVDRSCQLVAVSHEIARRYEGGRTPATVQPSGVDFDVWRRLVGPRTPDPSTVLFVGRLATKKGVADAIRAVAGIPDARLRIVGDGPEGESLRLLTEELAATDRIRFLGRLERESIAGEFRSATCVVIPSVVAPDGDRDGTPNVLGEAAAAGVPIIASRIAGLEDCVEDGRSGLLHRPGEVEDLRRCIVRMLSDPADAEELARRAAESLRGSLDMPRVADRYAEWYRAAMSSRPISRGRRPPCPE